MNKKQSKPVAEKDKTQAQPALPSKLQDEFAGQGGSYLIDPATNKRVKNLGDSQNG